MSVSFSDFLNGNTELLAAWDKNYLDPEPDDNQAPVAVDDIDNTSANTAKIIDVLKNDSDPDGDPLTIVGAGKPEHGTVEIIITEDGKQVIKYTPVTDYEGQDTFTYTIGDGKGGQDEAQVTVEVTAPAFIKVDLDTLEGTDTKPAEFPAEADKTYHYLDSVSVTSNTLISHFGADDALQLIDVTADDVDVSVIAEGTRFEFTDGQGAISQIQLTGVTGFFTSVEEFNLAPEYGDISFN